MMKMIKSDEFCDEFSGVFLTKITKVDKITKSWKEIFW